MINIPENYVIKANLKEGDNLKIKAKKSSIVLEKN